MTEYLAARERERAQRRAQAAQAEARHARDRTERQRIDSVIAQFEDEDERLILTSYAGGTSMENLIKSMRQLRAKRQLVTLSIDLLDALVKRFEACYDSLYPAVAA